MPFMFSRMCTAYCRLGFDNPPWPPPQGIGPTGPGLGARFQGGPREMLKSGKMASGQRLDAISPWCQGSPEIFGGVLAFLRVASKQLRQLQ